MAYRDLFLRSTFSFTPLTIASSRRRPWKIFCWRARRNWTRSAASSSGCPCEPARANYYEVGFTKSFAGKLRIDGNVFRRDFRNYSDDDVLLDTGVSFPIAFSSAEIHGEEIQIAVPRWGRFSGALSYSNQTGTGQGPITGGLFLGR